MTRPAPEHSTSVFRALDFSFRIQSSDPALAVYLESLHAQFVNGEGDAHTYRLIDRGDEAPPEERYELHFDDELLQATVFPPVMQSLMLWHINQQVVAETPGAVLVHAAAAQHRESGLVLPARMESGKSTLVAGLVRAGLEYLTDETVAFDPGTLLIRPFPKALSIDPGSWEVLADLKPDVAPEVQAYQRPQWHVVPDSIRPGAIGSACAARYVIAPRYESGSDTRLEPMSRAEGVMCLAENSFNVAAWGGRGLHLLGEIVRKCDCFRLVTGDLDRACAAIFDLIEKRAP